MGFYDLSKAERIEATTHIQEAVLLDLNTNQHQRMLFYFGDEDTYIRKVAYLAIGKLYQAYPPLQPVILHTLTILFDHHDFKVRQTVINAAGEVGKYAFSSVQFFFDKGLFDVHHSPRNAVIGSVKKMGEVNPVPVLSWAQTYLHHTDKEVRREICHGIELRGRKYPQDILPLLQQLEFDKTARVRNTLVHVLGQIAYKKGCLETVIHHLQHWQNKQLVKDALAEIIDVHYRYRNFSVYTQQQATDYIEKNNPLG